MFYSIVVNLNFLVILLGSSSEQELIYSGLRIVSMKGGNYLFCTLGGT